SSRRDEIVEEIVNFLRPWKNHERPTIVMEVNRSLDSLPELAQSLKKYFDTTIYADHTKKLGEALMHLETLLLLAPGTLPWNFFDPMPPLEFSDDDEYPLQQPMPYKSLE